MTDKLYYYDSHLKEFTAKVQQCIWNEQKGCYGIILDRTAFFPEGGGQYADSGLLDRKEVLDVQEKDEEIIHYLQHPLEVGILVKGSIYYEERFSKMQQHTGEHIISGIIHRHFGYDNIGFHLGRELATMDFNGTFTQEQLRQIEYEANEAVTQNLSIQVSYPSKEELDTMNYRSKKEIHGQVRIVIVPGYDTCACCAPHVARTGEIGLIKLIDAIKYKGGTRITMVCGFRALKDYQEKEASVRQISRLLSAKPEDTASAVMSLQEKNRQLKERLLHMQNTFLEKKLDEIGDNTTHFILFESELDQNAARRFVNAGMHRCTGICAIFLGNETSGYQYIIGSQHIDLKAFLKDFHENFPGKGGGKKEMVQGTVSGEENALRQYITLVQRPCAQLHGQEGGF